MGQFSWIDYEGATIISLGICHEVVDTESEDAIWTAQEKGGRNEVSGIPETWTEFTFRNGLTSIFFSSAILPWTPRSHPPETEHLRRASSDKPLTHTHAVSDRCAC